MNRWCETTIHDCVLLLLLTAACGEAEPPAVLGNAKSTTAGAAGEKVSETRARTRGAPSANGGTGGVSAGATAARADAAGASAGRSGAAGTTGGAGDSGFDLDAGTRLEMFVERGPYFTSGQWHGYFWTAHHADGTTLRATNFATARFDAPICIQGMVAPTPDSTGNAILGANLNQAEGGEMAVQTIAPSLDGIQIDLNNRAGSELRVQIQALDGSTNDRARWCAVVRGPGGFIPWASFTTSCWTGGGTPYQREPISGAMLLVPGTTGAAVPYEVCLNALREAKAPAATQAAGSGG